MPGMSVRASGPSIDALTERLAGEGLRAQPWGNGPGDRYGVHEHGYDKVLVAVAGSIEFTLPAGAGSVTLEPGDRLDLPAGTRHGALVGPAGVTCLEAHLARGTLANVPTHHPGWGRAQVTGHAETVRERMA
jgi:quercetin dioxygenase-like cupin family protein